MILPVLVVLLVMGRMVVTLADVSVEVILAVPKLLILPPLPNPPRGAAAPPWGKSPPPLYPSPLRSNARRSRSRRCRSRRPPAPPLFNGEDEEGEEYDHDPAAPLLGRRRDDSDYDSDSDSDSDPDSDPDDYDDI